MPKGFSEEEKALIMQKLFAACKANWRIYGYRKTSIDMLCQSIGISKGAFYLFFDRKESLFFHVIQQTQAQLYELAEQHLEKKPSKYGVAAALKEIFAEYCSSAFLYDTKSPDFQAFFNKLSQEQRSELIDLGKARAKVLLHKPYLSLKIDEDLALSVLTATLMTVSLKETMLSRTGDVFSFMIDHLIEEIFV